MNILILTAATGGGHIQASRALEASLKEANPLAQVEVVDGLKYINKCVDKIISGSYLILAKYLKRTYKKLYELTDRDSAIAVIVEKLTLFLGLKLLKLVNEVNPDVIVVTHPFLAGMISVLKGKKRISAICVCIMTDYEAHKSWLHPNIDVYSVAWEHMVEEMTFKGIPREKVYPFGIPVNKNFFNRDEKIGNDLMDELGLDKNLFTILIMSGSFGVNNIKKIYKELGEIPLKFQVVILTGSNKKLFNTMQKMVKSCDKPTRIVKFTRDVHRYMNMADILITKPGGMTVSESLAADLPLVVFDAIPGQEEANTKFLVDNGRAITIGKGEGCKKVIEGLLRDEKKLKALKDNCIAFDKSNSVDNLMKVIMKENLKVVKEQGIR